MDRYTFIYMRIFVYKARDFTCEILLIRNIVTRYIWLAHHHHHHRIYIIHICMHAYILCCSSSQRSIRKIYMKWGWWRWRASEMIGMALQARAPPAYREQVPHLRPLYKTYFHIIYIQGKFSYIFPLCMCGMLCHSYLLPYISVMNNNVGAWVFFSPKTQATQKMLKSKRLLYVNLFLERHTILK